MADDIKISTAKLSDHDDILKFLRLHYYNEEPLTIGSKPRQQDAADEKFNMSNIAHGTCLKAVQTSTMSEVVVGAVLAGPKYTNEAEEILKEAAIEGTSKWGRILKFLGGVERDANVYERYGVDKALHAHVLAVDTQLRGRSIGKRLMMEVMELGRSCGYPLLTTDCTSLYSAKLCERLGMECVNYAPFANYLDESGVPVFQPPAPHLGVKTYAIRL